MTTILDGKKLSQEITEKLKNDIALLDKKPHLAVILVGEDPASKLYVRMKEKKANEIGINSTVINYSEQIDENTILNKIEELNNNKDINAILVQLPLPKHINTQKVIEKINPKKDVDAFTVENTGKIALGIKPFCYPCTPKGIINLLDKYNIEIAGKNVVIVGRSNIVGKPLSLMMLSKNATITVCHSKTKNLKELTLNADILISAVGKPKLITSDMVKKDVVIIDVGTSKIDNKLCGDVDFENVKEIASYITPVPGGVGPMTIASLMKNTYELSLLQ